MALECKLCPATLFTKQKGHFDNIDLETAVLPISFRHQKKKAVVVQFFYYSSWPGGKPAVKLWHITIFFVGKSEHTGRASGYFTASSY